MSENPASITGQELLDYLRGVFPGREAINAAEFRKFLGVSAATLQRMRSNGQYPRAINLPGIVGGKRILLPDLAAWLEQGGCQPYTSRDYKKRGPKPKQDKQSGM